MTTIVFLHGRGLGPESAELVSPAFGDAELLAPIGGVALRRGHTWFENVRTGVAQPDSVAAAEQRLLRWLSDALPHGERVWLCGFSNGGALCGHMLMHHPERFLGAILLAAPLVLPPWPASALSDHSVFYAHGGAMDMIVDQHFYEEAEDYLSNFSGARCTIRQYDVGHVIAPEMIEECRRWFEGAAGSERR